MTAALILRFLVLLVVVAVIVGVGWWAWDYLIHNPLPYRDPEAIRAVATTPPR